MGNDLDWIIRVRDGLGDAGAESGPAAKQQGATMANETSEENVPDWRSLGSLSGSKLSGLEKDGRQVVRFDGHQIAIFRTANGLRACANRCPHEGYPLIKGSFAGACTLVCNWHGWAFDLTKGETLTGGDHLRTYPLEERGAEVWIDLAGPPMAQRVAAAQAEIADAVQRYEYERIARGLARLEKAGGVLESSLSAAIHWGHDRLEYGAGHAWASTEDWLAFGKRESLEGPARLAPGLESLAHIAFDARMGGHFPFESGCAPWAESSFLEAIEKQDEKSAIAAMNGAFAAGMTFAEMVPVLRRAALSHYTGFGHALIYTNKLASLVARLGEGVATPLGRSLVRYFVNASRDDLIPQFRKYEGFLTRTGSSQKGARIAAAAAFVGLNPAQAMQLALEGIGEPEALYDSLLGAAALMQIRFDEQLSDGIDQPISNNVGWLDFTHAITFANAVRTACQADKSLWPAGLLQMACFVGRNAGFIDRDSAIEPWLDPDAEDVLARWRDRLLDHGEVNPIYSCHVLKLGMAVSEEMAVASPETSGLLTAALSRFLGGTIKRRHVLRTVTQADALVAREGG